jgi:mxaJ protein
MRRGSCTERAEVSRLIVAMVVLLTASAEADPRVLRVCADPNNFPFSSKKTPGFENEIANVLAKQLGAKIEYTWWAQRRGFFRNTLNANQCDVVIGVPVGIGFAKTTAPYYRSSYVFVTRADRKLDLSSLDDERLKTLRIGVQLVGDDGVNSPPAHALGARGIVDNVVGFSAYSDYTKDDPPAEIMRAVADGTIDVAIAWGPLAGGFAKHTKTKLVITPVAEAEDNGLPFAFSIAVGVRRADKQLAAEITDALAKRRKDIQQILTRWGVPQL